MKIFITGSSGFIGGELISHLKNNPLENQEVVTFDLTNNQDILNQEQLTSAMTDCDVVIHFAALKKPFEDKSFSDYFQTNCVGTFNVAQAALKNKVKKFIYISSTSYYGAEKGIPVITPIKETNPTLTQHVKPNQLSCRDCDIAYSTSKVIAEQLLANYGLTKKMQVILLRLGPTRKSGEYKPFGELKLHLKIENALQAIIKTITTKKELWYEAFTIVDSNIKNVDISKAKELLDCSF